MSCLSGCSPRLKRELPLPSIQFEVRCAVREKKNNRTHPLLESNKFSNTEFSKHFLETFLIRGINTVSSSERLQRSIEPVIQYIPSVTFFGLSYGLLLLLF